MNIQIDAINRREVLQYLGWRGSELTVEMNEMIDQSIQEILKTIQPKYIWKLMPVTRGDSLSLGDHLLVLPGESAEALLKECKSCILFAATLGSETDRLVRSSRMRDMSKSLIYDSCASAAIEAVCDAAVEEIAEQLPEGSFLTDRFSPGYGDLPIEIQKRFTDILDTGRKIGLTTTDAFSMIPYKSVTALIGISDRKQTRRFRGCAYCNLFENCMYRRAGKYCGKE